MTTTALGIMQSAAGVGLDPITHRRIIKSKWENVGVVTGLEVSGRSDLRYNVAAGVAVVSRSDTDGYAEAYWEGGQTPAVSAGDPSNPRVDSIWIKANDIQQGDEDNFVVIGVTQGTPSSSPVAPTLPVGCVCIAKRRVPAGATSTSSSQLFEDREFAIPYGASLGLLAEYHDKTDVVESAKPLTVVTRYNQKVTLPTRRLIELDLLVCAFSSDDSDHSNLYTSFVMDGNVIANAGGETRLDADSAQTFQRTHVLEVPSGTHTFGAAFAYSRVAPHYRYGSYAQYGNVNLSFPGRVFRIWDRGVS